MTALTWKDRWLRLVGTDRAAETGSDISIMCDQFEPEMFVNLLILELKKEKPFKLRFLEKGQDENFYTLQISPNYEEKKLILHSKIKGQQPHQEFAYIPILETGPGRPFHLNISAEDNCFDIFIVKKKVYSYTYRSEVTNIEKIVFCGENIQGAMSIGRCLKNWKPGSVVYIEATAPDTEESSKLANIFAIDFSSTYQPNYRVDDIPLHISVRPNDENVAFNCKRNKSWQGEENVTDPFPFTKGKEFSMVVCAQAKHFEVGIDSDFLKRFKSRQEQHERPEEMSVQLRQVKHIKKIEYHP